MLNWLSTTSPFIVPVVIYIGRGVWSPAVSSFFFVLLFLLFLSATSMIISWLLLLPIQCIFFLHLLHLVILRMDRYKPLWLAGYPFIQLLTIYTLIPYLPQESSHFGKKGLTSWQHQQKNSSSKGRGTIISQLLCPGTSESLHFIFLAATTVKGTNRQFIKAIACPADPQMYYFSTWQ